MTDTQWALVEPLLPRPNRSLGGCPQVHPRRLLVDTVRYVLVNGCSWRTVPHDLAPWDGAYQCFAECTADGTRVRIHDVLRDQVRAAEGPRPAAVGGGAGLAVGHELP